MERSKRILGLEGGGTKTDWVLLTDNQVTERGQLPGGNLRLHTDESLARLFSVLPRDLTHVGIFLAGCATPSDRERLRRLVEQAWPAASAVVGSDRDSGIATAFHDGDGIVVIAGTGAAVHGRKDSRVEKAGGWGHVLGDRGGGYDLARQGLRQVLSNYDLDQKLTPLAERILQQCALNSLADLAAWAIEADKMSVARLAPAIFAAVRLGETAMLQTITEGAGILAEFTHAVARRLNFPAPPVRLLGGLFAHHPEYVALFKEKLQALLPGAQVELCATPGSMGAAWLAGAKAPAVVETKDEETLRPELARATTEASNPRSAQLDTLAVGDFVDLFINEEDEVTRALREVRPALIMAIDLVSTAMKTGGRLFYIGAGTSGRLGVLDASEIPPTFGASPELVQGIMAGGVTALHRAVEGAEDQPAAGRYAVLERGVRAGDVVCGIAASGRTPFVLGGLAQAAELRAHTLLLTCNPARERGAARWDVEIDLPTGPELITGSTRLKAGTATKLVLNLLSTGAMVRLGRVRGNSMVDLRITNEKLRDRGLRMVRQTLGVSEKEARARLEAADWNVRTALED